MVSVDAERTWFRYHELFADLLRLELRRTEPGAVAELHRRAAAWLEEHGLVVDAIRHAQAAADWPRAARLVADHSFSLSLDGQDATMHALLGRLPGARALRSGAGEGLRLRPAGPRHAGRCRDVPRPRRETCVGGARGTAAPLRRRARGRPDVARAPARRLRLGRGRGAAAARPGDGRDSRRGRARQRRQGRRPDEPGRHRAVVVPVRRCRATSRARPRARAADRTTLRRGRLPRLSGSGRPPAFLRS